MRMMLPSKMTRSLFRLTLSVNRRAYKAAAMSLDFKHPWFQNDANSFPKDPVNTQITGKVPAWLEGSLYRNGPGIFALGESRLRHLFDGFSVLHRFTISNGEVTYLPRILDTDTWQSSVKANRLVTTQFGTYAHPDPCKNLFHRVMSFFKPRQPDMTDNTSVNIVEFGDRLYAMTETPLMLQVDPETLQKKGTRETLPGVIAVHLGTAHPHFDSEGNMFYLGTAFNPPNNYNIIKIAPPPKGSDKSAMSNAELKASLRSRWHFNISYNHSFGMSRDYFVIMEQPVTVGTFKIITSRWRQSSVLECFDKHPTEKLIFRVVRQSDGKEVPIRFCTDPGFTFHFVNCYEDKGHLVVDFVGYENLDIFEELSVDNLDEQGISRVDACFRRYILPLNLDQTQTKVGENLVALANSRAQATLQPDGSVFLKPDFILDGNDKVSMELPRINYDKVNGRKYRYVYGTGIFGSTMQLTKLDLERREVVTWKQDGWMPGEPVFVPEPGATKEDEGVVLCPVLSKRGDDPCFLVILDGQTFQEIARAETPAGLKMPVTFHGNYVPKTMG